MLRGCLWVFVSFALALASNAAAQIILTPAGPDLRFGDSVAIDGDTIVVGAYLANVFGLSTGTVYVFERNEGGANMWGQTAQLLPMDVTSAGRFGKFVVVSRDLAVVSNDPSVGPRAVYVFQTNGVQLAQLALPIGPSPDLQLFFCGQVGIQGTTVVATGYMVDSTVAPPRSTRKIFVFEKDHPGLDQWGFLAALTPPPPHDGFVDCGISAAISRSGLRTTVVATTAVTPSWIFERVDPGVDFEHLGTVDARILGMSGDRAIGYVNADIFPRIYKRSAAPPVWTEEAMLTVDATYFLGADLSGDVAIATGADVSIHSDVFVFERHKGGINRWGLVSTLDLGSTWLASNDGTTVVAGDVFDNVAYVYEIPIERKMSFYTLEPCRAVDTRLATGPLGGPGLFASTDRTFPVTGVCGVPASAKAVSANVAVTGATSAGNVALHPGGSSVPVVSTVNYISGQTRSNNAVLLLNAVGQFGVFAGQATGIVHLVVDVNGYFE